MLETANITGIVTNVIIIIILAFIAWTMRRGMTRPGSGTDGLREQTKKNVELLRSPERALRAYVLSELLLYERIADIENELTSLSGEKINELIATEWAGPPLRNKFESLCHWVYNNPKKAAGELLKKINGILAKFATGASTHQ